jgi:hypothetical protein
VSLESWEQKDHHCGNHVLPGGKKRLKEAQHGAAASSSARGQGSRGRRKGQRVIGPDPVSEHDGMVAGPAPPGSVTRSPRDLGSFPVRKDA